MSKSDDEIIDVADKWNAGELELKKLRINIADKYNRQIIEELSGVPGLVLIAAIVIMTALLCVKCKHVTEDCSDANKDQLERLLTNCESSDRADRKQCQDIVVKTMCKEVVFYK